MGRLKKGMVLCIVLVGLALLVIFGVQNWTSSSSTDHQLVDKEIEKLLDLESKKSFEFFWNEANTKKGSAGYGLIRDRAPSAPSISSIASVGFGLTAYVIGVERNWITYDEAYERTLGTLETLLYSAEQEHGHFYHFLDMRTGGRAWESEVSIIDTAIAINGAIIAGEYFGGEIKDKSMELYERVDWEWYRDPEKNMFYMGYSPETGFSGNWDFYAEQLMLYFLGSASPTHPTNPEMFYDFQRRQSAYGGYPRFIHSWHGSIFTYQFSHAWFDLRKLQDKKGVDWYENSIIASLASRQYSIDESKNFDTLGPNSWGMTASDGPNGYNGHYGAVPNGYNNDAHYMDGTIPPAGAAGSIVFTPQESIAALNHYYKNYPKLWGKYGFMDAYNLDVNPDWYATDVIGINKGITLLMIENFRTGLIWDLFMKNEYVQSGMKKVGLTPLDTVMIDHFEGGTVLHNGWDGLSDGKELQVSQERAFTGLNSLKADVEQSFSIKLEEWESRRGIDTLRAHIFGKAEIEIVLKDEDGKSLLKKSFSTRKQEDWNDLIWRLDDDAYVLDETRKIQFNVRSKDKKTTSIYLDDLQLQQSQPAVHNVIIHGDPRVGETLTGSYVYVNPLAEEGRSSYQWLMAESPQGDFKPIKGANSKTYTIKPEDKGKFIKFKVIPQTKGNLFHKSQKGDYSLSEFLLKIEE